jgi:O-antigen ligase
MLWRAAVSMLTAHPLLGVGLDNFRWLYASHAREPHFDNRVHTNNMFLELLVSGGIVGGLASLWLLTELLRLVARVITTPGGEAWIAAGGVCALVAFLLHGVVDSFLTFTPSYVMAAVTVGLLVALDAPLTRTHAHRV